ncbi:MAG: hypothetical protein ABI921_08870, partial [Panacibacter sp.]
MGSGIDIEFVREAYQKMPDQELIRVLTQDAAGLTPEAQEVVKEEIKKRNLDPNIIKGVDAQQKSYTNAEIDVYCEIIQRLPCPVTGSTSEKLNATLTAEVTSFIFFTQYREKIIIGSPDILDKASSAALKKTALLGWWAIPEGILKSIKAIVINIESKKLNRLD